MEIQHCSKYSEMSLKASKILISQIKEKPSSLLGVATGNSPKGLYELLAGAAQKNPTFFKDLGIVKLDEWGGIPMDAPNSCESFIQDRILGPLQVPQSNYISFNSNPNFPEQECLRVQNELQNSGPLDVCILGLGKNGHVGFNEPALNLVPNCHRAELSKESQQHQMVNSLEHKPAYGLTLGMGDILNSKMIILLITGSGKDGITKDLLKPRISTSLPASFLWLHSNVKCFIDMESVTV